MTKTQPRPVARHGDYLGYFVDGCRCEACKAAAAAYQRELRARRKAEGPPPHVHGTRHGYLHYSCRCVACADANKRYKRDWDTKNAAKKYATEQEWRRRHRDRDREYRRTYQKFVAGPKRRARLSEIDIRIVTERDWQRLCERYGWRCAYCGKRGPLEQDHVVPVARGGRHAIGNLLPACKSCNCSKRHSLLVEWRAAKSRAAA